MQEKSFKTIDIKREWNEMRSISQIPFKILSLNTIYFCHRSSLKISEYLT